MKVDQTIADVILNVSKKLDVDKSKVFDIVDNYYKGVKIAIEEQPPSIIKLDFLGKIIFNNKRKQIMDSKR